MLLFLVKKPSVFPYEQLITLLLVCEGVVVMKTQRITRLCSYSLFFLPSARLAILTFCHVPRRLIQMYKVPFCICKKHTRLHTSFHVNPSAAIYDQIRAPPDVVYMVTYTFSHPDYWKSQLQVTPKITDIFPKTTWPLQHISGECTRP